MRSRRRVQRTSKRAQQKLCALACPLLYSLKDNLVVIIEVKFFFIEASFYKISRLGIHPRRKLSGERLIPVPDWNDLFLQILLFLFDPYHLKFLFSAYNLNFTSNYTNSNGIH